MSETKFVDGLFWNAPRENAPEFVLGSMSISKDSFIQWLAEVEPNEKGYVNVDLLMSKAGKPYFKLNDYKPKHA